MIYRDYEYVLSILVDFTFRRQSLENYSLARAEHCQALENYSLTNSSQY